jgi:hypothetical protein
MSHTYTRQDAPRQAVSKAKDTCKDAYKDCKRRRSESAMPSFSRAPADLRVLDSISTLALLSDLKEDWAAINKEYQKLTYSLQYHDTIAKVRRKEEAEKELALREEMIQQLSHKYDFVQQGSSHKSI